MGKALNIHLTPSPCPSPPSCRTGPYSPSPSPWPQVCQWSSQYPELVDIHHLSHHDVQVPSFSHTHLLLDQFILFTHFLRSKFGSEIIKMCSNALVTRAIHIQYIENNVGYLNIYLWARMIWQPSSLSLIALELGTLLLSHEGHPVVVQDCSSWDIAEQKEQHQSG